MVGRPQRGFGHYLRDFIYGSLDGVITTLAVVSGSAGANLEPRIGFILGVANLVADGFSMGASNYLGLKSELEQLGSSVAAEMPWRHGLATFVAFVLVGATPLLAYVAPQPRGATTFGIALLLSCAALGGVGALRAKYVRKTLWRSAAEVLATGIVAACAAYGIGAAVEGLTR